MKIDVLSKSTVKVTMTAEDMSNYDVDFEQLSGKTAESRKMIGGLLSALQQERRLFRTNGDIPKECFCDDRRFFVETFPRMDGGCMLYISSLDGERKRQGRFQDDEIPAYICEIEGDGLFPLCGALVQAKAFGRADFKSSLYRSGNVYRLALIPQATCLSRLEAIAVEFGALVKGDCALALTAERFSLIIRDDAVEKLASVI